MVNIRINVERETSVRPKYSKKNVGPVKKSILKYKKNWDLSIMLLPVIIYFLLFKYGPMYGIILAFKEFNLSLGIQGSPWIGFSNFEDLFKTVTFIRAVRNTVVISLLKLVCGFPMPIILAILMNELRKARFNLHSRKL